MTPEQRAERIERFDSLIAYVETWADGGNDDGFADTLRDVRALLATAEPGEAGLADLKDEVIAAARGLLDTSGRTRILSTSRSRLDDALYAYDARLAAATEPEEGKA